MRFIEYILSKTITAGVILLMLAVSPVLASCKGDSAGAAYSSLAYVKADVPQTAEVQFNQDNSYVIRCISSEENAAGISFFATKTKSANITSLIFISLDSAPQSGLIAVPAAVVPVTGGEGECSLAGAAYHFVNMESAQKAVDDYGITYTDWLNGTTSSSEKFPCCQ
jgi:hypothetical protein